MESPGRTNDDETSPPDFVDDVDLELGVCPVCLAVAGLVQLLPRFLACLYFTEVRNNHIQDPMKLFRNYWCS
jgi:hypothetical protein